MIALEIKWNSKLDQIQRNLALPILEVSQMLALDLYYRVQRGLSATGTFSALGSRSSPSPGKGLFWVPPSRPQPAGYVTKATTGELAGWAGYRTYRAYTEALGSPPRRFKLTGQLMNSMKVRVMGPGRVKIAFYGGHRKAAQAPGVKGGGATNASGIAWFASRDEADPMLMPSAAELTRVREYVREHLAAITESATAQFARKRKPAAPRRR